MIQHCHVYSLRPYIFVHWPWPRSFESRMLFCWKIDQILCYSKIKSLTLKNCTEIVDLTDLTNDKPTILQISHQFYLRLLSNVGGFLGKDSNHLKTKFIKTTKLAIKTNFLKQCFIFYLFITLWRNSRLVVNINNLCY